MKKYIILIFLIVSYAIQMHGVRAYPHPKTIVQPDGTSLTIIGHGDEFRHYITTTDGYTVIKGTDGIYRYALPYNGRLKASQVKALNIEDRTPSDKNFLTRIERFAKPSVSAIGKKLMRLHSRNDMRSIDNGRSLISSKGYAGKQTTGDDYRGLVIMVNFTDRKFSRGDKSWQLVNDMMNKTDHTYYEDPLLNARFQCTGSVRDYFIDNSGGQFVPEFDVVGPIEINADQYYIKGTELTYELCKKVLEAADQQIDYSRYDSDGDGEVDMFYIIYAGYSSSYQGNDERLVWPHAGHLEDFGILTLDGVRFGRFACSSEIYGWHDYDDAYLDGIGVIVHEFSHVLGFKDHYDISGYLNEDPGSWDVMASGNYNGVLNDTPCGYSSYEKYAAGFIKPRTLTPEDNNEIVSLRALSVSNDAMRIISTQDSAIFMLENRQLDKWDRHLPGHGMLVWRVDSCDKVLWDHNALNVNGYLHLKLVRANGATRTMFQEIEDKDYDPFPGTRGIYDLTNYSLESNLLSAQGYPSPLGLRNIHEGNGIISFTLEEDTQALHQPYTFSLKELYGATGTDEEDRECEWNVSTGIVESNGRERSMIYNLVPDTRNISATDDKYSKGLGVAYSVSGDRRNIIIEPYRVAIVEDYGVWLVDFNDLDNGGSGAVVLDMNPYGDLSLSDTESVLGYCYMPKNSAVVTADKIIDRFSLVKNIKFNSTASSVIDMGDVCIKPGKDNIFNLQGMRVNNPLKGEIYIINGKKVIY